MNQEKCVIVLDGSLPAGVAANTATILGITMGQRRPDVVGSDVCDGGGWTHSGIIRFPVPVLRGTPEILGEIRAKLSEPAFSGLTAVDFTDLAQGCRTYKEFIEKMAVTPPEALHYMGLALCGEGKLVSRLTGSLPLMR